MSTVTLDRITARKLKSFNGDRVAVCDEDGAHLGYFQAQKKMTLEEMEACFTPEELARKADASKPRISMEEVMKRLGIS